MIGFLVNLGLFACIVIASSQTIRLGRLRRHSVKADPEMLQRLKEGWSPPVQVHAEQDDQGDWELLFREVA